jgi:hypothetical protein
MPEYLKKFLEQLTKEQKEEVWVYLDGSPDAIDEMIELVGE